MTTINKREIATEKKQTEIKVVWTDNGQIMAKLICTPDKLKELKELINFIKEADF